MLRPAAEGVLARRGAIANRLGVCGVYLKGEAGRPEGVRPRGGRVPVDPSPRGVRHGTVPKAGKAAGDWRATTAAARKGFGGRNAEALLGHLAEDVGHGSCAVLPCKGRGGGRPLFLEGFAGDGSTGKERYAAGGRGGGGWNPDPRLGKSS